MRNFYFQEFLAFARLQKSEYSWLKNWVNEEDLLNDKLFGFSAFYNNQSINLKTFDIWTPKTWHSFCLLVKDKEATFFLDKKPIFKNEAQFEVLALCEYRGINICDGII